MITRIGLVVHGGKPAAVAAAQQVRSWAVAQRVSCIDIDVWSDLGARPEPDDEASRAGHPDLIVTVGGDGTLLRGVRIGAPIGAGILGVNVGRVGFLTDVDPSEVETALDAVHRGDSLIDARLMLTIRASRVLEVPEDLKAALRYDRTPCAAQSTSSADDAERVAWGIPLDVLALNDVVVEKLSRDRQASVAVYVTGRLFGYYSADALIVASSTGSTAYSFSAGGPIVSPHLDALIFTPVAPHMIFDRSIVVAARDQRIGMRVLARSGPVAVSVDGRLLGVLEPGDWLTVYAGAERAKLVRLRETDFLGRVRDRFGLADSAAAMADGTSPAVYDPDAPMPDDLAHPGPPDITWMS